LSDRPSPDAGNAVWPYQVANLCLVLGAAQIYFPVFLMVTVHKRGMSSEHGRLLGQCLSKTNFTLVSRLEIIVLNLYIPFPLKLYNKRIA
jgi:hypothetical protein